MNRIPREMIAQLLAQSGGRGMGQISDYEQQLMQQAAPVFRDIRRGIGQASDQAAPVFRGIRRGIGQASDYGNDLAQRAMQADTSPVQSPWEGAARMGANAMYGMAARNNGYQRQPMFGGGNKPMNLLNQGNPLQRLGGFLKGR